MTASQRSAPRGRIVTLAALSIGSLFVAPAVSATPNATATAVSSAVGAATPTLTMASGTARVGASDRYGTAVAMSRKLFPDPPAGGVNVVIASGESFADAMIAASIPSLGSNQVMLLVRKDSIPSGVEAELRRLRPASARIIGGAGAVSEKVAQAVKALTTKNEIHRYGGRDRYETSVKAAALFLLPQGYAPGAVIIASGEDYADAITAAQLNNRTPGMPVILTRAKSMPAPVVKYLREQPPWAGQESVVVGGPAAVSEEVATIVRKLRPQAAFTRLGGKDRYETAAKVVAFVGLKGVNRVYLATGKDFPDALVASAAAVTQTPTQGAAHARLLLTTQTCQPPSTASTLAAVPGATRIVVGLPTTSYGGSAVCTGAR